MILDTNALSALAARNADLIETLRSAPRVCVTMISLGEYLFGVAQSRHRAALQAWLDAFLEHAEILNLDRATLPFYAEIRRQLKADGKPIPANDCWIAALAKQHRLPVVSLDKHFDAVKGLRRIKW
jgi:tRNA(fMet)-specific endonuclease VapC